MSLPRIAVLGASGRLGRRILALATEPGSAVTPVAALVGPASRSLGLPVPELPGATYQADVPAGVDVLVDVSAPAGTLAAATWALDRRLPLVVGTTGLEEAHLRQLESVAQVAPVLRSNNLGVGVNVLLKAVALVAQALGPDADCEIVEAHHRFKADAPSGTAMTLLDAVLKATGRGPDVVVNGRAGQTGARPRGQVGMHALRLGDTVGEHSVHFGWLGETVTLSHSAHTRDVFANGAIRAAAWLVHQPPGLYRMSDALGL